MNAPTRWADHVRVGAVIVAALLAVAVLALLGALE